MPSAKFLQSIIKKLTATEQRLLGQIDSLTEQFPNGSCPTQDELIKIIAKRNTLANGLTQIQNQILSLTRGNSILNPLLTGLSVSISLIKVLPLPTAIPGVTAGVIVTVGDVLRILQESINKFKNLTGGIETVVQFAQGLLTKATSKLQAIDALIERCSQELGIDYEIINNELNSLSNSQLENIESKNTNNNDYYYKGFTFEIKYDELNQSKYPKRYAVARNQGGIIVLKSESSFASDPNVLIEELKFQIDTQNLKAN